MYPNLRAEMSRRGVHATDLARVIHKTARAVQGKMKGEGEFTLSEAFSIRESYFKDHSLEYLFQKEG